MRGPFALDGILTAHQVRETAAMIVRAQRSDGAIPWFVGEHLDPWDHTEAAMGLDVAGYHDEAAAAYRWLADNQHADGAWYASYTDGTVTDDHRETNFTAYVAVGAWHHFHATGDLAFLARMWPTVRAAIEWVLATQTPGGEIPWARNAAGRLADEALLTGSSSVYHALRCALAAAERMGEAQPDWELAAGRLGHAILGHPERFAQKERFSMDWYYPVLGTVLRGDAARRRLAEGWGRFVIPGLGVRCVDDRPWVTGGETAELVLTLWALGDEQRARELLASVQRLRHWDGGYWTGLVVPEYVMWPRERTTWTAGAMLLAASALAGNEATAAVFGGARLPTGMAPDAVECDAVECSRG